MIKKADPLLVTHVEILRSITTLDYPRKFYAFNKNNVFNFGALTVENIQNIKFLNKKYLEKKIQI